MVIKGAGEVASGIAHFLFSKNLEILMTEIPRPTTQRRTVAFAEAVFSGETEVEGIKAEKATNIRDIHEILKNNKIPVLIDPEGEILDNFSPEVLIDGTMAKKNLGTDIDDAKLVIGVGPGFKAGKDVDIVIETAEKAEPGRIISKGGSYPNTGIPCDIMGYTTERVLRAPADGVFKSDREISDSVEEGDIVGKVDGKELRAGISGTVRGLVKDGLEVVEGQKLGDIDPRGLREFGISDRSIEIARGVWKAINDFGPANMNRGGS